MRAVISSSAGFQSDMQLVVEQCVAQVREAAGLASFDAAVPLPRSLSKKGPPPLPKRLPPPLSNESSNAFLGLAPAVAWADLAAALPAQTPRALAVTVVAPRRKLASPRRWPMWLCAFVAVASASAALVASPIADRPAVRRVVVAAQTSIRSLR